MGPDNPSTSDYTAGLSSDWYDYLHDGSYIVPALHTYNYPSYVPPGYSGTGPKGSWLLPQLVGGASSGALPHAVDLATGKWTRFSTGRGTSGQGPYAGSIEDTRRGRVYWGSTDASTLNLLDLVQSHPRTVQSLNVGSFAFGGYYARHVYVAETDMAVGFWAPYSQTRIRGEVFDFSSGRPVRLGGDSWPAMDMPGGSGFGVDWCPETKAFYFYRGLGSTRVLKLKPSNLEFHQCTWTWSEEVFETPAWAPAPGGYVGGGEVSMSRWRYIPWLKCFAWSDGPNYSAICADGVVRDGVMQLWRPLGT